jgi:hypothetical protein
MTDGRSKGARTQHEWGSVSLGETLLIRDVEFTVKSIGRGVHPPRGIISFVVRGRAVNGPDSVVIDTPTYGIFDVETTPYELRPGGENPPHEINPDEVTLL